MALETKFKIVKIVKFSINFFKLKFVIYNMTSGKCKTNLFLTLNVLKLTKKISIC